MRPRVNQPSGYRPFGGMAPRYVYGRRHDYIYYPVAWVDNDTGRSYEKLYIVGGGAKNTYLNRLTEEATGKQVIALPIEATALGNLKIQIKALEGSVHVG